MTACWPSSNERAWPERPNVTIRLPPSVSLSLVRLWSLETHHLFEPVLMPTHERTESNVAAQLDVAQLLANDPSLTSAAVGSAATTRKPSYDPAVERARAAAEHAIASLDQPAPAEERAPGQLNSRPATPALSGPPPPPYPHHHHHQQQQQERAVTALHAGLDAERRKFEERQRHVNGLLSVCHLAITSLWGDLAIPAGTADRTVLPLASFIREVLRRSGLTSSAVQLATHYLHRIRREIRIIVARADDTRAEYRQLLRECAHDSANVQPQDGQQSSSSYPSYPSPPSSPAANAVPGDSSFDDSNEQARAQRRARLAELVDAQTHRALCGRRMFLSAVICASKFLQDRNYSNRAWAKISGLPLAEVNANERVFLQLSQFNLYLSDVDFRRWTERLAALAQSALAAPSAAAAESSAASSASSTPTAAGAAAAAAAGSGSNSLLRRHTEYPPVPSPLPEVCAAPPPLTPPVHHVLPLPRRTTRQTRSFGRASTNPDFTRVIAPLNPELAGVAALPAHKHAASAAGTRGTPPQQSSSAHASPAPSSASMVSTRSAESASTLMYASPMTMLAAEGSTTPVAYDAHGTALAGVHMAAGRLIRPLPRTSSSLRGPRRCVSSTGSSSSSAAGVGDKVHSPMVLATP